jgi:hypothetical protein
MNGLMSWRSLFGTMRFLAKSRLEDGSDGRSIGKLSFGYEGRCLLVGRLRG